MATTLLSDLRRHFGTIAFTSSHRYAFRGASQNQSEAGISIPPSFLLLYALAAYSWPFLFGDLQTLGFGATSPRHVSTC